MNGTTPSNFYIDDIQLFNSTLTSTEISDLYNSYSSSPSVEYTITQTGFYRARVQGTDIGTPIISPLASEIFYTPYTAPTPAIRYTFDSTDDILTGITVDDQTSSESSVVYQGSISGGMNDTTLTFTGYSFLVMVIFLLVYLFILQI